jgi:hypothetical protein
MALGPWNELIAEDQKKDAQQAEVTVIEDAFREVASRKLFYKREFGSLAFLPKASDRATADDSGVFRVLPAQRYCRLKSQQTNLWFQFNHRSDVSNGRARHLGVILIVETPTDASRPIEFARNEGWKRNGSNETLGEFYSLPEISWESFSDFMSKSTETSRDDSDKVIGGQWHATPIDSDQDSWTYRQFWSWAMSEYKSTYRSVKGQKLDTGHYRVSARLMRYTMTQKEDSDRPVVFTVNASGGDRLFLALYSMLSSGQDLRKWHWMNVSD